jgi:hypothetical protein
VPVKVTGLKGVKEVNKNVSLIMSKIKGPLSQDTITKVLIAGNAAAAAITPVDTANMINSQFRSVNRSGRGWIGTAGYTAEYAKWVHEMPGTLKGRPRSDVKSFTTRSGTVAFESNQGNFWGPNGEPEFLLKGFERDALSEIVGIIADGYKIDANTL